MLKLKPKIDHCCIFLIGNIYIVMVISLKFDPKGPTVKDWLW